MHISTFISRKREKLFSHEPTGHTVATVLEVIEALERPGGRRCLPGWSAKSRSSWDRLVKCSGAIHAGQAVCRIHSRAAEDSDMAGAMIEKAVEISAL